LRNEEAVVCDPAEDPSSCPTNRRCEDEDGDGEYNCVCDKRFYTTHTLGHCVLGFKELVYDMEKELAVLEEKQEHDNNWLNETLSELLEMPTTTTTTTTTVYSGQRRNTFVLISGKQSPKTDVADFANPTYSCQHQIADFPNYDEWQAGGGWVDGVLIACSVKPDNKCYSLSEDGSQWNEHSVMSDRRWTGAGVVIKGKNGDPDRLWQIGPNQNGDFIYANGTIESGSHLFPYSFNIDRPCMVQVETGDVYIIGGGHTHYQPNSAKRITRWNYADGTFTQLKTTIQERLSHACATFKSAKHGGREVIYVAGGQKSSNTAEILDYSQTEDSEQIINLPWSTTYGPVALTNLDGTGVYHHYGGVVSELTTDGTSWSFSDHYTIQNQNHGRVSWPNIIPIPDTMANCS